MDIRKDFVSIHGEMVLLKNYSSLNFAGRMVAKSPCSIIRYAIISKPYFSNYRTS